MSTIDEREREQRAQISFETLVAAATDDLHRTNRRLDAWLEERGVGAYTAAEIVCMRELLHLSQAQLARMLGVSVTAVKRWEAGERAISDANAAALDALTERADRETRKLVAATRAAPAGRDVVTIYRDDAHMAQHEPERARTTPASWVRMIAARVRDETACTVKFAD